MAFTSPPPLVRYGATPGAVASAWVGAATAPPPHMSVPGPTADALDAADAAEDAADAADDGAPPPLYGADAYFAAQDAAAAAAGRGPPVDPPGSPPRFRMLVVGSGPRECALAAILHDSARVHGLYYCPDEAGVCAIDASKVANSTGVSAFAPGDIVRFCRWALVDAVFVGPDRGECVGAGVEEELAASGITVFGADVGGMLLEGVVSVDDCVRPMAEAMAAAAAAEEASGDGKVAA